MKLSDFVIGKSFWTATSQWLCTDVGTRTIAAIKLDHPADPSWSNGPPYAVCEYVFDEDDQSACCPTMHDEGLIAVTLHSRSTISDNFRTVTSAVRLQRIFEWLGSQLPVHRYDVVTDETNLLLSVEQQATTILVIKVISPDDDPDDVEKLRLKFLDAGTVEIWIVYNKTKTIHIFHRRDYVDMKCIFFIRRQYETFISELGIEVNVDELFK